MLCAAFSPSPKQEALPAPRNKLTAPNQHQYSNAQARRPVCQKLFEKGRNLVLSEAGLALRSHAEKLVDLHNHTLKQVKRYENKRPLRLGCPEDYNDNLLPKIIKVLQRAELTCSVHSQ